MKLRAAIVYMVGLAMAGSVGCGGEDKPLPSPPAQSDTPSSSGATLGAQV